MKRFIFLIISAVFLTTSAGGLNAAMTSSNYQIWADDFSIGGGEASSTLYKVGDTLGESAIGRASSTNYSARGGFREMEYFRGDEVLTLSVGASSLSLGALNTSAAKTGSHTLTVDTNADYGVSVVFSGATLTCSTCSGTNTVTGIGATAASSAVGTSQFGFNVIKSSGTAPTAASRAPYDDAAKYAFNSGDQIVASTNAINSTVFDVNYLANISGSETAGNYSSAITFTATANF